MISKRVVLAVSAGSFAVMLWPVPAAAQHHPGPPPRTTVHVGVGGGYGYYRPYPYYGYWGPYSPFYFGFGYGWGPWYASPWYASGWGGPYGYGGPAAYYYPNYASARIEVKPNTAHVYLDGYLVGEVDQFDGVLQRLDLPTGDHEIAVYQPGYRTFRQRTLFRPGEGYHFKAILEPLAKGTTEDGPPKPDPNRPDPYREAADPYRGAPPPREPYYPPQEQNPPYPGDQNAPRDPGRTRPLPERPPDRSAPESHDFGTLNVRVQPGDAVVIIDGERWDSPQGGSRLVLQLAAGEHRIEVRKDGFKTYSSTVRLRPGETQTVNVSLPAGGGLQ